jgi:hypothetical protein
MSMHRLCIPNRTSHSQDYTTDTVDEIQYGLQTTNLSTFDDNFVKNP